MPKMNGFDATRRIMETRPTPIVIVSGAEDAMDTAKAFRAIESGALAVLRKPSGLGHPAHERRTAELVRTVKLMSEVKVVRRWPRYRPAEAVPETRSARKSDFRPFSRNPGSWPSGPRPAGPRYSK